MKRFIVQLTSWNEEKGKQVRRNHAYYETAAETLKDYYLNNMCKAYTVSIYDRQSKKHITMTDLERLAKYDVKSVVEEEVTEEKELVTVKRVTTDSEGNVKDVNIVEWDKKELIQFLISGNYEQIANNTWEKVGNNGAVRTYTIEKEDTIPVDEKKEDRSTVEEEAKTMTLNEVKNVYKVTRDIKQLVKQVTAVLINMSDEKLKEVCEYYKLNYINNYSYGHKEILAKHIAKIVSSITKKEIDSIVKLIYAMAYNKESIIAKKDNQNRFHTNSN